MVLNILLDGKDIGKDNTDLIAKYPNACDSIKSPLRPNSSEL